MEKKMDKLPIDFEEAEKIFNVWKSWHHWEHGDFDQVWCGYSVLRDETGIEIKKIKKFIKFMRDNGFAFHTQTINEYSAPSGSGSFLYDRYIDNGLAELLWVLR
jgi:hypothetical protein